MLTLRETTRQILIVEDDEDTAEYVSTLLETAGFTAVTVDEATTALTQISETPPDLVLLDLGLPDMNGLDLLQKVRENSTLPLIVMSGYSRDRDKVSAFDAGADDYLTKPFQPEILVARVNALLRRVERIPPAEPKLTVRQIEVDMARRSASISGKKLHLTPIEYGILVTLMRKAGEIISHDELLHAVWGDQYKGDFSVLRVNISRLRQKLEENPRHPSYIVTVAGQGYTLPTRRV